MRNEVETLVILSPGFPENEADSTCMPSQQVFVKALKEVCPGLNIIIIAFQYPFTPQQYQWHGVTVISLGGQNKGKLSHMATLIKAWLLLQKLNRQNKVIGLLSFWFGECALIGSKFAKQHKLSHYSWLLGQDAKRGNKYFNRIKPKGDSLIALSDFLAKEFKFNYGVAPFHVIPSGIDITLFGPEPVKRDIDILGAGSLIPLKQYELFIECIAFLKKSFPEIKAAICGKGPELEKLQAIGASLHLEGNLSFMGELPHTEVLALMQRCKVFLHPSNYEGFSTVLAEALYAGAHVVSFCKPMTKDYRHHHVVKTKEEMNAEVLALLNNNKRGHDPVLIMPAHQVAKNVISLFADSNMAN